MGLSAQLSAMIHVWNAPDVDTIRENCKRSASMAGTLGCPFGC